MDWKNLEPGELFEGRYRIESVLGIGGFAHVYKAEQEDLGRPVALKILRPPSREEDGSDALVSQPSGVPKWVQRFEREAKVIAQLRDQHTITMYDYGHTAGGISYMVFEFVSGQSLKEVMKVQRRMTPHRVVSIMRQCLYSMQEAHSMGILHRDLKPANIMLYEYMGDKDRVKVLDFGIAKPIREQHSQVKADLTQAGTIVGTPRYMAPEHLMGKEIGSSSDIFSLGLVAYELLTGQQAVPGDNAMKIISNQLSPDPIVLPEQLDIPLGLRTIINSMMDKDELKRFRTADEVFRALEMWQDNVDLTWDAKTIPIEVPDIFGENSPFRRSKSSREVEYESSGEASVVIAEDTDPREGPESTLELFDVVEGDEELNEYEYNAALGGGSYRAIAMSVLVGALLGFVIMMLVLLLR